MFTSDTIKNGPLPGLKPALPFGAESPRASIRGLKSAGLWRRDKSIVFFLAVFVLFAGCDRKAELGQAQNYAAQSQAQYQRSVRLYKDLISKGQDTDRLYFELGQLYYEHGDFAQATEQLRNSNIRGAKKFLAIAYYHLGDFTDALREFDKEENKDDESLYYYGDLRKTESFRSSLRGL